eukprot:CAMPEP_0182852514 /NCGR_PEP_ID=MMETSP0034_2-20130328/203_1 /TAXON_ID=156128 /ORGANISM="Nephroselmis pyriformis, Strain CCMP717" /LENGTH=220 /DNA_ID=CAMNT_0024983227 /DNA_START=233 /DNA_END=892 /DNA_ORIENTATION=-
MPARQRRLPSSQAPALLEEEWSSRGGAFKAESEGGDLGTAPPSTPYPSRRPSPASAMKESVKYVCACLSALGIPCLNAEAMRQAKFDGQGVAPKFWRALHDLILLDMLGYPRSRPTAQLDELWRRVDCEGTAPQAVAFVQAHLGCLGYPSEDLYRLTHESDESRPLLMALGWLLAELGSLEVALERRLEAIRATRGAQLPPYPEDLASAPGAEAAAGQAR